MPTFCVSAIETRGVLRFIDASSAEEARRLSYEEDQWETEWSEMESNEDWIITECKEEE